jgi:hypothetical protein
MFDALPLLIGLLFAAEHKPAPRTAPPAVAGFRIPRAVFLRPFAASPRLSLLLSERFHADLPAETPRAIDAWWHEGAVVDNVAPSPNRFRVFQGVITQPKRAP